MFSHILEESRLVDIWTRKVTVHDFMGECLVFCAEWMNH
jgi:hypothetical protein